MCLVQAAIDCYTGSGAVLIRSGCILHCCSVLCVICYACQEAMGVAKQLNQFTWCYEHDMHNKSTLPPKRHAA